jgi:hypothetical protein
VLHEAAGAELEVVAGGDLAELDALDLDTLAALAAIAERRPFILEGSVLVRRSPRRLEPKPAK